MVVVFGVGVAVLGVSGSHLGALSSLRFRAVWLIYLALGLQLLVTVTSVVPATPSRIIQLGSYVVLAVFLIANQRLPHMRIVVLGAALNIAAIAANGGVMPARAGALRAAGVGHPNSQAFENSTPVQHARIPWLGDEFDLPQPVPFSNVFSIGDILIVAGGLLLVSGATRDRPNRDTRDPKPALPEPQQIVIGGPLPPE